MIQSLEDDQLWSEYKRTGNRTLRDQLIVRYASLVKFVAGRVSASLPRSIEQSDLVSYGMFGLIDALDKFDPSRNVRFETYAITRIKGAIIDELRSIDWVPRSVRAKARSVDEAYAALEGSGRAPTDAQMAAQLEITEVEMQRLFSQISYVELVALESESSDGSSLSDSLAGPDEEPMVTYGVEEMKQILAGTISELGERERIVLALYYFEGLTLAQSGEVFGVTESRVCQIHTKAITQLRQRLPERLYGRDDDD